MQAPPAWANPDAGQAPGAAAQQQMSVEDHQAELFRPYSTLDEPVMETIMRDARAVASKLQVVLLPLDRSPLGVMQGAYAGVSQNSTHDTPQSPGVNHGAPVGHGDEMGENESKVIQQLKDWDLWGPLLLCLALGILLSFRSPTNQASIVFASVFTTVWVGSGIVTINAQLLGGTISFFQSVCVLGYCIFPMVLAAFLLDLLSVTWFRRWLWLDLIILAVAFVWSTRASSVFIGLYVPKERRFLAVFPVLFFYTFLGWLILLF